MLSISMQFVSLPVACYITAIILALAEISEAAETITRYEVINDSMTLVSAGGKFKLGFFRPGNSENRYLGIWFNIPTQTIVWVANRNNPLNDSSGVLKIGDDGNLILVGHTESIIWSTNIQNMSSNITIAQLLGSGNLVLRDEKTETYLWQSFDYPSDTLLAGMKLGWNLRTGLNRNLTSWKSADDPSPGDFSFAVDLHELPQTLLRRNSVKLYRSPPWDGLQISGAGVKPNRMIKPTCINNSEEVYYQFDDYDSLTTLVLNYSGVLQRVLWNNQSLEWLLLKKHPGDMCESYGHCGPNAICTVNDAQVCSCLAGYMPKSSQEWAIPLWSGGCVRKKPLNCPKGEGFIELKGVEIPDLRQFRTNTNMTLKECRVECLKNCSCTAYANSNTTGDGRGCLLWYGDLIDIRRLAESANQNLYIRVTASELDSPKKKQFMLVMVAASAASVLLLVASCIIWKKRTQGLTM
ncbi:hypothetical protein F0562_018958 [Nyssa sinensis]|uniref:non-specific serine/threonine protein kinase n=1 Tax=Nyssa sinensis TaxID=561372 RepID=A0A5J4ZDQ5_9ASTE|nr:hypothetical protein F0562_018958 [Nyssa sinensis]